MKIPQCLSAMRPLPDGTMVRMHTYDGENWTLAPDRNQFDSVAARMNAPHCVMCNSTGDVLDLHGNWAGRCTCPAGRALLPWTPADIRQSVAPCDSSARIDVRFRDGTIVRGAQAYTWAWGEAGGGTITYWRMNRG